MMGPTAIRSASALLLLLLFAGLVCTQYSFTAQEDDRRSFDPTLSEQLERGEEGMASREAGLLLVGLAGGGLLWLSRRRGRVPGLAAVVPPILVAAGAYALFSIAWADVPSLSAKRWVAALLMGIGAFGAGITFTEAAAVRLLFACALLQAAGGLVLEAAAGTLAPFAAKYRFAGGLHPNGQAVVCALLFASGLTIFRLPHSVRERSIGAAGAALGLLLLLLTRSRTAFAALLVTGFVLLLFAARPRHRLPLLAGAVAICALAGLTPARWALADTLLLGRTTDTDRTPIWQDCMEYVAKRPVWGYGYNGFWTPEHVAEMGSLEHWGVSEAHSSYLEILLDGGVAGALLDLAVLGAVLGAAWREWRQTRSPHDGLFLAVLLFAALHGLLESQAVRPTLLMFVSAAAVAQVAKRRASVARVVHAVQFRPGALVARGATRIGSGLGGTRTTSAGWR